MMALVVERLVATRHHIDYENRKDRLVVVYVIFSLAYAFAFAVVVFFYNWKPWFNIINTTTCVTQYKYIEIRVWCWFTLGSITLIGLPIMRSIYKTNRKIQRQMNTGLSSRYQLQENIMALKAMIPAITWGVMIIGNIGVLTALLLFIDWYFSQAITGRVLFLLKLNLFVIDIAPAGYEVIFIKMLTPLNETFKKDFSFLRKNSKPTPVVKCRSPVDEGTIYFRQFDKQWC
ncbi:unnamed protein product [Bursaphelenchus okinawaensis]|uniref:G_PROTEIN_RECEP_F1_2 domain-containing protein n=1 Tax=Bursaphelenchus okinawaensis TaxID=465554 RepID=A0A811KY28_9BILA|nr:unnamed protein product [Bursaphelenchus okinawaensis]CAG9115242.1 unnamed protein product [Bursaphelenchus okinawaensis]